MKDNNPSLVAIIISDVDKAKAFEWIAIELKRSYKLVFILIGNSQSTLYKYLKGQSIEVHVFPSRNGINQVITMFAILLRLLFLRPNVVHTHLIKANLAGLTAAWLLRIPKRIYTRHHALVHHNEHPKGLWQDRWCNRIATHIIAISKNIENILTNLEGVSSRKIRLIHHGFDLEYFSNFNASAVELIRVQNRIPSAKPIIGVVARYQSWKGIQYIIPAFSKLKDQFPNAHLVLANAFGSYQFEIKRQLRTLPRGSYTEITFEHNAPALFRLFDVYVHVPIDAQSEAFGQTYIEALACGVPSVFTLSGVATEFIKNEVNAMVVPFRDASRIQEAVLNIINNKELNERLIANGKRVATEFTLRKMTSKLVDLYNEF